MSGSGPSSLPELSLEEIKEMYREALKKRIAELESKIKAATRSRRLKAKKNDVRHKEHGIEEVQKEVDKEFQLMMKECNARGFVYLLQTQTGIISGASESMESWWSETLNSRWNEAVRKESDMDQSE